MPELIFFTSPCPRRRASMHTAKVVQEHAYMDGDVRLSESCARCAEARLVSRPQAVCMEMRRAR